MDAILTRILTIRDGVRKAKADLDRFYDGASFELLTAVAFAACWAVVHPRGVAWPFRSRDQISRAVGRWRYGQPMWKVWFRQAAHQHLHYTAAGSVGVAAGITGWGFIRQGRQETEDQSR